VLDTETQRGLDAPRRFGVDLAWAAVLGGSCGFGAYLVWSDVTAEPWPLVAAVMTALIPVFAVALMRPKSVASVARRPFGIDLGWAAVLGGVSGFGAYAIWNNATSEPWPLVAGIITAFVPALAIALLRPRSLLSSLGLAGTIAVFAVPINLFVLLIFVLHPE